VLGLRFSMFSDWVWPEMKIFAGDESWAPWVTADPRRRLGLLIAEEGIWSLGFLFLVWHIGVFAEKWSKRVGGFGRET
jgi:hypothetical protein